MPQVGINGFGRVGRMFLRNAFNSKKVKIQQINDPYLTVEHMLYLFKYDSTHGMYRGEAYVEDGILVVEGRKISVSHETDPRLIPWHKGGVSYILECTGKIGTVEKASEHLRGRVKKVIVTTWCPDAPLLVVGINHVHYTTDMSVICSGHSTTHCVALLAKVLHEKLGIEEGVISIIHATVSGLKTVDGPCSYDWRRGRSAFQNIIPSNVDPVQSLGRVLPELQGKVSGKTFFVPVANVSLMDFTCRLKHGATYEEIMNVIRDAANSELRDLLGYTEEEIVSQDVVGEGYSCLVDVQAGFSLNKNFVKLIAWYDNEMGYSNRLEELLSHMHNVDQFQN